ncbi:hypothetical protein C8R43DRAFT_1137346 [Mycena crocata]|nr:hypothetical protein C8R43DRAFT_1137346 [Mycena crocata]
MSDWAHINTSRDRSQDTQSHSGSDAKDSALSSVSAGTLQLRHPFPPTRLSNAPAAIPALRRLGYTARSDVGLVMSAPAIGLV